MGDIAAHGFWRTCDLLANYLVYRIAFGSKGMGILSQIPILLK